MAHILVVEDEPSVRRVLALNLEAAGHEVVGAGGPDGALEELKRHRFDVVLTDLRMEGRDAGLEVVRACVDRQPEARVMLLTAYASAETAVQAMRDGAYDYLTKPVSGEELTMAVEQALAETAAGAASPREKVVESGETLVGDSPVMRRVRERLIRAARRDFTVLITGESGTGKELAARFVHRASPRCDGPFVPVHCGAIPGELFEAELFGHRRGAFTGADADRVGLIESAHGGTLFLDEVGEMPPSAQVKLLRVLQERAVRRVGEERERAVDIRVVAATNRDLSEEVRHGRFREDLFYRLNVVPVHLPPLRQRREDVPELVDVLLRRWSGEERFPVSPGCMRQLEQLPLLGNVRELENLLQRMVALSADGELDERLLGEIYQPQGAAPEVSLDAVQRESSDLDTWLERAERRIIGEALQRVNGRVTQAAELLGISFRSLRYRLKKLGIKGGE